jgi:hypothetical protein
MHYLQNMVSSLRLIKTVLFIIPFFFIFSTCKKNKGECIGNAYQLKEAWNIFPQKDSINIGDTLIFSSNFSNKPLDYNSNTNVDFSGNALIGTSFSFRLIKGYNDLVPSVDSFSFFTLDGRFKDNDVKPNQVKDIFWFETNSQYKIKIGIIARKRGDYLFTITNAIGKLKKTNECENSAGITLTNNNSSNNAYLFRPYYGGNVPSRDSLITYCVRVR